MTVRARFYIQSFTLNAGDTSTVRLSAVCRGKENADWAKHTPSGNLEMSLTRQAGPAAGFFQANVGKDVYLDIALVEQDICTQCGEPISRDPQGDRDLWGNNFQGADGYVAEYVHNKCVAAAKERLGI